MHLVHSEHPGSLSGGIGGEDPHVGGNALSLEGYLASRFDRIEEVRGEAGTALERMV